MATESGPLRLHAPTASMYDTSAGETAVLRGLTPETIGMMLPFLQSQEINQQNRQNQYGGLLESLNQQQRGIAGAKLQNDRREMDQKAALGLVQYGGMGVGPALNAMRLEGLPGYMSTPEAQLSTANTDLDRRMLDQSKSFLQTNQGVQAGVEAGLNPDPGQVVGPGAAGVLGVRRTVGEPLSLRRQALANLSGGSGSGGDDDKVEVTYGDAGNIIDRKVKSSSPERALQAHDRITAGLEERRLASIRARGGNNERPQGAGAANASDRPTPSTQQGTAAPASGRTSTASGSNRVELTAAQRSDIERRIGPISNFIRTRDGKTYALGTNDRREEVR